LNVDGAIFEAWRTDFAEEVAFNYTVGWEGA
jgi:hypothetical protein